VKNAAVTTQTLNLNTGNIPITLAVKRKNNMHDWDTKSPLNINPPQRGKEGIMETKTISVKQIEVELWQQFRARAMLEGESVPAALNQLLREAVKKEGE